MFTVHRVITMRLEDLELFVQGHIKIFASYTTEKRTGASAVFKMTHEVEPGKVWKCGQIEIFVRDEQVHFMSKISSLAQQDAREHHQMIVGSILEDLIEKGVIVMDAKSATKTTVKPGPGSAIPDAVPSAAGKIEITDKRIPPKPPARWGMSEQGFCADAEGEIIVVHLVTGETLTGELIGVDQYTFGIQPDDGFRVLIQKHAVSFMHMKPESAGDATAS